LVLAHSSFTQRVATASHSSPLGQPSPRQLSSTQRPDLGSQVCPLLHVTPLQMLTQAPALHVHAATVVLSGAHMTTAFSSFVCFGQLAWSQVSTMHRHSPFGSNSGVSPGLHVASNSLTGLQNSTHLQPAHF
jgi:hypothetical protein